MGEFTRIAIWVLSSAGVCLIVGYYLGVTTQEGRSKSANERERKIALNALVELLQSVKELTSDVDDRSLEIRAVGRHVGDLKVSGELENVRKTLLGQIADILKSNQRLEDDLHCARCHMEEQAEELDRTRREAHTDALSGVANRKAFDDRLRLLLTGWNREQKPFALVLADLDHFKWINDTYGHPVGDRILVEFTRLLKRGTREGDLVSRLGGDEFAILMPGASLEVGVRIANRMLASITETNFKVGAATEKTALTASFGVANVCPGDTGDLILCRADQALYRSKNCGRSQVQSQESIGETDDGVVADTGISLTT